MPRHRPQSSSRRRLLAALGAAASASVAGCSGSLDEGESRGVRETTEEPPLGGHPAASGLTAQPRFGPEPTDAEGVVVAFEDPSCPRCAAFETETVPKLRERLGDRVSFVYRGYPVVYPWGEPATQAVEAAFARETGPMETANEETDDETAESTEVDAPYGSRQGSVATWKLIRHYFENQSRFGADNVLELTREFLAAETDLDAAAVVSDAGERGSPSNRTRSDDAESGGYDDAVRADLDAGEAADVGQTTPTVFLFRDGEYRTSAKGSVSFDVVESALGL